MKLKLPNTNLFLFSLTTISVVIILSKLQAFGGFLKKPAEQLTDIAKEKLRNSILRNAFKDVKALDDINLKVIQRYKNLIVSLSDAIDVNPEILTSIIWIESQGNESALGKNGEIGLMQLKAVALQDVNENFGRQFTSADLFTPNKNLTAGSLFLFLQIRRMSNLKDGLRAFNQGEAGAKADSENGRNYSVAVRIIADVIKKADLI